MKGKNQFPTVTKEIIIQRFINKHGDKYDYSDVTYKNMHSPVAIKCKIHGTFYQTPHNHLKGTGCPECSKKRVADKNRMTVEEFIRRAREVHGDKYDYSKVEYKNNRTKVCIICPIHGEFWQTPYDHMKYGCKQCAVEYIGQKKREKSAKVFKQKAGEIHNFKYVYEDDYKGNDSIITIHCPIHGKFFQRVHDHLQGCGCPKCGVRKSENENKIYNFIKSLDLKAEQHNRTLIKPSEIDIFIPEKNIGIEYNGLIWHSERFREKSNYHLEKTNKCKELNIRLIHIFEDEFIEKEEIIKSMLSNILGVTKNKIFARKCNIKTVSSKEANNFFENNHIQGKCKAKIYLGLYYNDELVSLISFGKTRQMRKYNSDYDNTWELLRFCNKLNTTVVGGASKLLKHFIEMVHPNKIITYADKRWSNGNLYEKLGFTHTHDSKPNYFYVVGQHRENRFKYRKGELVKKGFSTDKSEHEIMLENNIYRIYDCGSMCFEMILNKKEDH